MSVVALRQAQDDSGMSVVGCRHFLVLVFNRHSYDKNFTKAIIIPTKIKFNSLGLQELSKLVNTMNIEKTFIKDLILLTPAVFEDERGYFFESYNKNKLADLGIHIDFLQDNQSFSKRGVIRGLHLQMPPFAQAKLVRVLEGEILDVAVDLRKNSPTYGQHVSVVLSAANKKQLLVPHGFAHGFSVLSETASVLYKVDQKYHKESERGIRFDDATLEIDWQVNPDEVIVSEKDLILPSFKDINWSFE